MYFSNELLQAVLLLGFVQGSICSVLLFSSKKKYPPNRLIGILLLVVSMACLNSYFFHAPWFQARVILGILHAVIPLVIVMPVGPLLFLYVRQLSRPDRLFSVRDRWHFLPVLIDLVPYFAALIYLIGYALNIFKAGPRPWADFIDSYDAFADVPRWLSITVYLVLAWRISERSQQWANALLTGFSFFQLIWLLYLIPYLIPDYNMRLLQTVGWYPVMVPLAALIYWAGIKAYLFGRTAAAISKPRISLTEDTAIRLLGLLERTMKTEKLYLDPQLQLNKISAYTSLSAKTISAVLNQHLGQSFNQWVNSYRVETFKLRLASDKESNLTLAGIASECGFNSSTSFQRIFKQHTGMVPTEFRDSLLAVKEHPNPDLGAVGFLA
ncbi:MAG: AraC-type DNA-binding protein [Mucilaginibacter sp.]|nr:AraC-type DNA-binding protein [Mucilaginibacter sp.]